MLVNTGAGVSRPNPSLFYLPGLRSLPFWTPPHSADGGGKNNSVAFNDPTLKGIVTHVESYADAIREEYLTCCDIVKSDYDGASDSGERALHTGQWDWHSYILNGKKQLPFTEVCPITTQCLREIDPNVFFDKTPFAFAFFSTLNSNTSIKAHTGPMNLRLRFHLPLIAPTTNNVHNPPKEKKPYKCGIRCGNQYRQWIPNKAIILDDSYDHEVWNDFEEIPGNDKGNDNRRAVLLFDVWHPDISLFERKNIERMFEYAKHQGWIGKQ